MDKARPVAIELLRELHGKPLDYKIFDTTFTKGDITTNPEVALNELKDEVGRVEISTFTQIIYLRMLGVTQRPSDSAMLNISKPETDFIKGGIDFNSANLNLQIKRW